MNHHST